MYLGGTDKGLQFLDAHMDEKGLIFSAENLNGLFRLEIGKSEAEFLGQFEGEVAWQKELHRQVICFADRLYFIPFRGNGVTVYDKLSGKFTYVEIKEEIMTSRAFLIGNDIYMIPYKLKMPFIIFHTENNSYEIAWDLWHNICREFSCPMDVWLGLYSSFLLENKLYLKGNNGQILNADLENWQISSHELSKEYRIRNMYFDRGVFYLTLSDKRAVVRWDFHTGNCYEYQLEHLADPCYHPFMTVLRWRGHLLLLPDQTDKILELDEKRDEWRVEDNYIPNDFDRRKSDESLFVGYEFMDDNLLLFPAAGNGMIILSEKESRYCEVDYSDEFIGTIEKVREQFVGEQLLKGNILYENNEDKINLKHIISVLPNSPCKNKVMNLDNIGIQIWHTCR